MIRMVFGKPGDGMKLNALRWRCSRCGKFVSQHCWYCDLPGKRC